MPTLGPRASRAIWFACFAAAFGMTHLPAEQLRMIPWSVSDGVLHVLGYTGLGGVTIWMWTCQPHVAGLRTVAWCVAGFLVYAAMDEGTQPLVGRSCELSDWLADVLGASVGTIVVTAWSHRQSTGGE